MVIVEVIKPYRDRKFHRDKRPGDLFRTERSRAQELVKAGVAKIIAGETSKKEET